MTCKSCKKYTENKTSKVMINATLIEIHVPACDSCIKDFKDKAMKFLSNPMVKGFMSVSGINFSEVL